MLDGYNLAFVAHCSRIIADIHEPPVPVEYAGEQGGMPGVDQVNLRLVPALKGLRDRRLVLTVDGQRANPVWVDIH